MAPQCIVPPETFWTLLRDPAHWAFELFLMGLFDGVIGLLLWPYICNHISCHIKKVPRKRRQG